MFTGNVDAASRVVRPRLQATQAEKRYGRALEALASNVGKLAEQVDPDDLPRMMQAYADALRPWATRVATKMVAEVDARNVAALSKLDVSSRLRRDLRDVDVDFAGLQLIERQVEFILDIPRRAAERASEDYDPVAAARSSARRVARLAVSE